VLDIESREPLGFDASGGQFLELIFWCKDQLHDLTA
jgi:hypothetical protein